MGSPSMMIFSPNSTEASPPVSAASSMMLSSNEASSNLVRSAGRVVGSTRFGNIDRNNHRVEIGWTWIGRAWQRTALNTEAKLLMLSYAFDAAACMRVELKTDALNQQSRAAISRLGAKEEGTLRKHIITQRGRCKVLAQEILAQQLLVETEDHRRIMIPAAEVLTVLNRNKGTQPPSAQDDAEL